MMLSSLTSIDASRVGYISDRGDTAYPTDTRDGHIRARTASIEISIPLRHIRRILLLSRHAYGRIDTVAPPPAQVPFVNANAVRGADTASAIRRSLDDASASTPAA